MKSRSILLCLLLAILPSVRAGTLAQFRTVFGDIEVELYDQDKPITTQNFIRYVQSGAYTNGFFHRCIPNFVVQGGGFAVANAQSEASFALSNVFLVQTFPPITNEFDTGPRLSNAYGTIAMAKTSNPNSATSQFFFNLSNNAVSLDNPANSGGFTVFGRVVSGTNVLNFFNSLDKPTFNGVVDFRFCDTNSAASFFSDLPVRYAGPFCPRYVDLFHVDVSLLQVKVQQTTNGSREVSWNSVSNRLNHIEFTTGLPPVWQSLASTNGTGSAMQMIDPTITDAFRFYRVRVDY